MVYSFSRFISYLFLKVFFRLQVKGAENIPKEGGFILASNHVSYLDPVVVGVACPRKVNYMARRDLFSNPLFAWFLRRLRVFPVKRSSADISALKEAISWVKRGFGLVLFPEGTRSQDGRVGQAHDGIGFLAAKLDVPVIPAYIQGTEVVMPKGAKGIHSGKVSIIFGNKVSIERRSHYHGIAQKIMQDIRLLS
ncbi:lysophospholipid acyltransferase family protein [Candidatus Omnitrophota bacterium]